MQSNIETRVGIFVLLAICVFVYMGFQIGVFRLDRRNYSAYTLYFKDISGLSRKADVKIAGVKVGWVEEVGLLQSGQIQANTKVMIKQQYTLYKNAYAIIRQDGFLGPKYIEIAVGDPLQPILEPNSQLGSPGVEQVSVDDLMRQFKHIANNIVEVTDSIKTVLGGQDGKTHLGLFIQNASNTFAQFSNVGDLLSRSLARNEQNIDAFLSIGNNLKDVTDRLQRDVFPSFQNSIEKISQVFDRDFDRIATHLSTTAESLDQASVQAREGMEKISSVAQKIDEGKGLIGKLINEDETYNDLRSAIQGFRSYVSRIERMQVLFDSHFESMHRSAENFKLQDSKGYFDVRIHPNEDHFYLIQFASSQKGYITRQETLRHYVDKHLETINVNNLILPDGVFIKEPLRKQKTKINRNGIKIGLQFGKIFGDIALRFGFFDGTAGVGCDVDIPFGTEKFRWVTSLELFDMSGWNRIDDRRPHFKWINKMYFMRNLYFVFGADDFISKNNASGFVGAGLRFGDDDVKYLLSSISGVSGSPVS